jgi:CzcA family heavy metal efflux pump
MWLTRLALRNPVLILMLSLMALVLGAMSLNRLSVDLFPNITIPVVRVATFYAGAGPVDIEKSITLPVERAVAATPGVQRVESTSKQGVSVVSVWFDFGVNLDNAQFEVAQRVSQIQNSLPPGVQQPFIMKFDITNIPVASVVVSSDQQDERQLRDLAYNIIEPQFERINGVASATVGGGLVREIQVLAERDALRARGLGINELVSAIRNTNFLMPSGTLRTGDRQYNLLTNTQVDTPMPLQEVIVRPPQSGTTGTAQPVRVSDVARVVDGVADQSEVVRVNGKRGVYLRVLKQPGANTIAVVDALRTTMGQLRGVPPDVTLALSFDQSSYIRSAVKSLQHEALQGGLLAVFVILVFLLSLRATGIVAVAIPLSIIATFVLLFFTGQTLNVFTLGGLALGVGRLVDDSIVELENIQRHINTGQSRKEAVLAAAQEVAMPILVSTITTIVVFLPVLFITGVARFLFLPLAMTIAFSLVMSFLVSRTVTPVLCFYWLKPEDHRQGPAIARVIGRWLEALDSAYARALSWSLRHRAITVGSIGAFFALSLLLKSGIGSEFFPETDESQFTVMFKAPIGARVERSEEVAARVEAAVDKTLGDGSNGSPRKTVLSSVGLPSGRTALFTSNTGTHAGNIQVGLSPRTQRALSDVEAAQKVRTALRDELPGIGVTLFTGGIVKRILNFGSSAPIDVEVLGYDLDTAADFSREVMAALQGLKDAQGRPLLTDLLVSREQNAPELDVTVDRQKAGMLGVSEQEVAQTVLTSLVGSSQVAPIPYTDPATGNEYAINVRLGDEHRGSVEAVRELFVRTATGKVVSLQNLATIERGSGPVMIDRKYLQRVVHVTANVAPQADLGAASEAVRAQLSQLRVPDDFTVGLSGQAEEQAKAFAGLTLAGGMALALVYMVLASQFKSLIDPLVIMFSVPLGISGVFLTLLATGTKLSVNSFMGIIMMVGIVVSNGVLLVDFANVLRRRGRGLLEATVQAGRTRLRPILMTTIATVVGLIPMALGIGEGSETNLPLARAVIGGLSVSTVFTLFLVPVLYTLLDRFARRHDFSGEEFEGRGPQAGVG